MTIAGRPAWIIWENTIGMPTSPVTVSAISCMRAVRPSCSCWRYFARSSTVVELQVSKARHAAFAARSTSSAVPSGMRPMTASVVALTTSMVPDPVDGVHAPSM